MKITKATLYRITSLIIFTGVLMLCQPFSMVVFGYGFPVVLTGTLGFIILDHIPDW